MAEKATIGSILIDIKAGLVVFLVALPLCLGVAMASKADPFAGLIAGVVGGLVVAVLSGSHTSVSGPAAGLTAIVAAQLVILKEYPIFLLAVVLAGMIQIVLGLARAGFLAAFIPSSVIQGLLAAIGVILVLKQIPHLVGDDQDPEGDMAFDQPDKHNTFNEFLELVTEARLGPAVIGLTSVALLFIWGRWSRLKYSPIPAPLVIVLFGVAANLLFRKMGGDWLIESKHLVDVPVATDFEQFFGFLKFPDFGQLGNGKVYVAAFTIAAVASLETLLNLEAVDKIDPQQRLSPPSRELIAQGVGNVASGMIGGLPVTSVIVRSSVNINAGNKTKLSSIVHGLLLLVSVAFLPAYLNLIPESCLAAILFMTGLKLASIKLAKQMWKAGWNQFVPFIVTVVAIVVTDLLIGVLIGLALALANILRSNARRPIRKFMEKHIGGEVIRIELANQVSFLNRAALDRVLQEIPHGSHVLLDAQNTDYIDPDILALLVAFKDEIAPARNIEVSILGFRDRYQLQDHTQVVDYSTRELQTALTPLQILQILREGHERSRNNKRLTRDFARQMVATAQGQHPLAVVVSCIDSRTPAELIFDLGMGDIFSIRLAGNIASRKMLGSVEYACAVAGAKLIFVMGHTRCGAVTAAVERSCSPGDHHGQEEGAHINFIVDDIRPSIDVGACANWAAISAEEKRTIVDAVAKRNVERVVETILRESQSIRRLVFEGKIGIVGAIYDVGTGSFEYLISQGVNASETAVVDRPSAVTATDPQP